MTDIRKIEAAAERLRGHATVTPLLSSPFLDELAGRQVLVKAECLQKTGSFKFRGGWSAVTALSADQKSRGVIAFSSGNHAQGVALAAKVLGVPAVIVMPSDAPKVKIENTRRLGAEVVLYERATEDRVAVAARANGDRGLTLIQPFDDEEVIAGQGTVGLELVEQAAFLGVSRAEVLVCCGGGGLTSGIALALERHAPAMIARTSEPEGFDDVARSLASGRIERNERLSGSLCDAILTPSPGNLTFPILKRLCGAGLVVSEDEALHAMALAFEHLKIVLEPGGAVSLAAALFRGRDLNLPTAIAVVTGGNVDRAVFDKALARFA